MSNPVLALAALASRIIPSPLKRRLYELGAVSELIRKTLNRAATPGLTQVRVAAGALSGQKLLLDLRLEKDYWLGTYELEVQSALQDLVRPGVTVYDVGANIGYLTMLLADLVGDSGHVFAFEALPANIERLRANLDLNPIANRVSVVACAVTDRSSQVQFLVGPSGGTGKAQGSAGRNLEYSHAVAVPGITLDDFVHQQGHPAPDLIKLDIEGGELQALAGMKGILRQFHPLLILEIHGPESAQGSWEQLHAAGYTIHSLQPGYPKVKELAAVGWKAHWVGFPSGNSDGSHGKL